MVLGLASCLRRAALTTTAAALALAPALHAAPTPPPPACASTVTAKVVALATHITSNRMGANLPAAMIFALANDVQSVPPGQTDWTKWTAGYVELKDYKRPRPLVLRVNRGQCLKVYFRNLIGAQTAKDTGTTATASLHLQGLDWATSDLDDGSWVGRNKTSLVQPGGSATYTLYASEEGPYLLYSTADVFSKGSTTAHDKSGGTSDGGQLQLGLFGAVNVQPEGAEYYRSQVDYEDLCFASAGHTMNGNTCVLAAPGKLPKIDYQATYPPGHPRAGLPVLSMLQNGELVHSDLTAIITGPNAGRFPDSDAGKPEFHEINASPDRLQPYREFTIIYHEMFRTFQAFADLYANSQLATALTAVDDNFAINYGMGGIGSEILANRFKVGPAGQCADCKYEEFFLTSWANGDPAMIVDRPASWGCTLPATGYPNYTCANHKPAEKAFYPDDPSNVYHSYLHDHTKFRILHGGSNLHHVHHLHAHQWLHSPNTSSSHYLDSQAIGPGSAFTLETVYNGGGNKNLTVGDSIFHCHFYPHFAAGMWSLWRVHDTFEPGTQLTKYPDGTPAKNSRALPDGEIKDGTPTVALVPLPTKPMAPAPAPVRLIQTGEHKGTRVEVCTDFTFTNCVTSVDSKANPGTFENPGYPFFIAGIGGSRAAHPPLDFARACSLSGEPCSTLGAACAGSGGVCETLDGGLPRHLVTRADLPPSPPTVTETPPLNPVDFSKEVEQANGLGLPEDGTLIEKVAMKYQELKFHPTVTPAGAPAKFRTNGSPAVSGAPYAEPCIDIDGNLPPKMRQISYWAVDFQTDAKFNKEGWHYPQSRMISLWGDVFPYMGLGQPQRPPQPFFIRANSNDCVHYVLASLVPKTYELDDFQVRTPTDILGQHIHLVKFDVTSSDGSSNGFNYEDGTLGPDEVTERISAFSHGSWQPPPGGSPTLAPKFIKFFGADPECPAGQSGQAGAPGLCQCKLGSGKTVEGGRWCGSQATVQRWYVDPTLNDEGQDLTLRTVFTHDHFGPSTHQQAGLFAALVSEPESSTWLDNQTGAPLGGRTVTQNGVSLQDGGATSWEAVIKTASVNDSFREFLFGLQDTTLTYQPFDPSKVKEPAGCPKDTDCGVCSTDITKPCTTDSASPLYYATACPKSPAFATTATTCTSATCANTAISVSCNYILGTPSTNVFTNFPPKTTSNLAWATNSIDAPFAPEGITLDGGTSNFSFNYRNEPTYPRIASTTGAPRAQDLSFVYASIPRTIPGQTPAPPYTAPLTPGVLPEDPFTPLLRAYAGDDVQVRLVVGSHQNPHNFTFDGLKWLFEPSNVNSGWRNTETMGISEHFEYLVKLPTALTQPAAQPKTKPWTDYLYRPTAAKKGQMSGSFGLLRAYDTPQSDLFAVPGAAPPPAPISVCPASLMQAPCPLDDAHPVKDAQGHQLRCYDVIAATFNDVFGKNLTYNTKLGLTTQNALIYLRRKDYDALRANHAARGFNKATGQAEPLVLRAAAGDCLRVKLTNRVTKVGAGAGSGSLPVGKPPGASGTSKVSTNVGLRPQLVAFDAAQSGGTNAGWNPVQTVAPGKQITYYWYAGNIDPAAAEPHIPIEFGASNLLPSDTINHHGYGLFGALIVEPEGASWKEDVNSYLQATVTAGEKSFREFVLMIQDDTAGSGFSGVDLRSEPLMKVNKASKAWRACNQSAATTDVTCELSNEAVCCNPTNLSGTCSSFCGAGHSPIQTPTLCVAKGQEARLRILHPGGAVTNNVFELFGHSFNEEPYLTHAANCQAPVTHTNFLASQVIAADANECKDGNATLGPTLGEWKGSRMGVGPTNHFDIDVASAGGAMQVPGDYLYRSFPADRFGAGIWGIFRVTDGPPTPKICPSLNPPAGPKKPAKPAAKSASGRSQPGGDVSELAAEGGAGK